jgi:hypothetical protein
MAKRFDLKHPNTHPALEEAILCLCAASDALLGLPAEEGALFHTLSVPGYGRVLAHESAIRAWFSSAYEEYTQFMAEHLVTRPEMVWSDVLSLSVPFRPDRLCLTLTLQQTEGGPPQATAYWNWSGSRAAWDPAKPTACERRHHLVGTIPWLPDFEKGHRIALAELLLCTVIQGNHERLPAAERPRITLLETAALPVPAPPPEKRPNPVGRPNKGASKSSQPRQELTAGDPRLRQRNLNQTTAEVRQLPDGREIALVDWSDLQYPFGRRVQSKLAALVRVDHLKGRIYWEEDEILQQHRQKGQAIPGQEIKMMHFKTRFGRVTLNVKQMIWAYWTAEVPDTVRRRTYIASHVPVGSLEGVYNMVAKGFKFGSREEREAFLEAGHADKLKIWRDLQGNETLIILRDRSYSKSLSPDFKVKPGTPDHEIQKTRKLPALIGKLFAEKAKTGALSAAEAYRRARVLCLDHRGWEDNDDLETPLPPEMTAVRDWLDRETSERAKMNEARLFAKSSKASAGLLSIMKMHKVAADVNDYSRFAEWWVRPDEKIDSILQEEFRVRLSLAPEDYGVAPIDMEALADERGRSEQCP